MRYLKPITLQELSLLWGFDVSIIPKHRGQQLYLLMKKDGTPHKQGGGRYVAQCDVRDSDFIFPTKTLTQACEDQERSHMVKPDVKYYWV